MYLNEAAQTLVIILAVALAVFLILGIIALTLLIKVLKGAQRITDRAEEITEALENSVKSFTAFKFLSGVTDLFSGVRNKGNRR